MPRSYSADEWELMDLPRRLAYEQSHFENPHIGPRARVQHAALLKRQAKLQARIRLNSILDRWVMRRYRLNPLSPPKRGEGQGEGNVLTPMGIDEVIEDHKIVDRPAW